MKKIAMFFSVLAASLLISALPVYSGSYGGGYGTGEGAESLHAQQKDECLLLAKNCPKEGMSVRDRIDKLNAEIAKGTDVYTADELTVLKGKLDDANKELHGSGTKAE